MVGNVTLLHSDSFQNLPCNGGLGRSLQHYRINIFASDWIYRSWNDTKNFIEL